MFWGLSSALDLYDEYLKALRKNPDIDACQQNEDIGEDNTSTKELDVAEPESLNILIYGGADPRHIIKTLAKRYTHSHMPELNFYIIDACTVITARNILLLGIALESPESFNLVSRVHLFMDIYGNSLLRPSSHLYMVAKSKVLIKMVTDDEDLKRLAPMLSIEHLKYAERDGLENTFNFWQPKEKHIYNIGEYWSARVRALLGSRYDHRDGAFDWDLSMTLKDREGQQICSQEYRYWRECGIAFVFPEYEQSKPNKTFVAGLVRNGQSFIHRGYLGDIQTGPFCGFGLRTTEERMLNSQHGENDYRATDITERNLLELFHELQMGSAYEHDKTLSRKYGSVKLLMGKRLVWNECDIDGQQSYDKPWIDMPGVKLHFVSASTAIDLQNDKARWRNFFDIAFVDYNFFPLMKENFVHTLRKHALLLLETKLLTVERKDDVNKFESKLMSYAKSIDLKPVLNYQAINGKNMVLKFIKY